LSVKLGWLEVSALGLPGIVGLVVIVLVLAFLRTHSRRL
jgi:hypothetical protein